MECQNRDHRCRCKLWPSFRYISRTMMADSDESWTVEVARSRAFSCCVLGLGSRLGRIVGKNVESLLVLDLTICSKFYDYVIRYTID